MPLNLISTFYLHIQIDNVRQREIIRENPISLKIIFYNFELQNH